MLQSDLLSISTFAKLSEFPRKTLIFYDQIGLFKPAVVAPNGYRYYHRSQLETIGVIHTFKELGMSLEEIRRHLDHRTPTSTLELLQRQEEIIQSQLARLERTRQMIVGRARNIEHSMYVDINRMHVIRQDKVPLLLSRRIHSSKKEFPEALWDDFQKCLQKEHAPLGYPNGVIIGKEDMLRKDGDMITHMYSCMKTQFHRQEYMPAGFYLVSYARADYGETERIFPQIFDAIERNHYEVIGDAYEEYLQDEIVLQNPEEYLVRIMVHIAEPVKGEALWNRAIPPTKPE